MKKLITALTATIMVMSMAMPTSATINGTEYYPPPIMYFSFAHYGFDGYYDYRCFDGENIYVYDDETGKLLMATEMAGFNIHEENGVYYMYSKKIDGEEVPEIPGVKKAPLADVLASAPRYEYKMSDMATVQRFFRNEDIQISLKDQPYLDYNADGIVNSVDLSLIKYELLH
ncbi:MAG: hypothetical protein LBM93_10515 [Oscillospiraceae bacterium]|jgi:hypothetical protein|nr:hypothetical protein [Oscillospiraceae bacterium]